MKDQIDPTEELARDIYDSAFVSEAVSLSLAIDLAEKGYRKQSEGEWIVDAWIGEKYITIPYQKHEHTGAYCSLCKSPALLDGAEFDVASNYCPNCGAKMKGGAE